MVQLLCNVYIWLGSLAFCLYALFYRCKGNKSWSFPFKVFGMNALASYAMSGLVIRTLQLIKIGDATLPAAFYSKVLSPLAGPYFGSFLFALLFCSTIWLFAYVLYTKKIFIKA
ncbi:MAG: hypothetical protein IPO65_10560 [Saprospiraceae bacterium]|nr:hypothetical protein [Saprospiraceae bacterium]